MIHVEGSVVLWEERIARVPKNGFNEVQIADQISGNQKPNFHVLGGGESRHRWADQRPKKERYKTFCLLLLRGGEGQSQETLGWGQGVTQEMGKDGLGH